MNPTPSFEELPAAPPATLVNWLENLMTVDPSEYCMENLVGLADIARSRCCPIELRIPAPIALEWAEVSLSARTLAQLAGLVSADDYLEAELSLRCCLLRMLGPQWTHPFVDLGVLLSRFLGTVEYDYDVAETLSADWHVLPHWEMLTLRKIKNRLTSLNLIGDLITSFGGAESEEVLRWLALRAHLP